MLKSTVILILAIYLVPFVMSLNWSHAIPFTRILQIQSPTRMQGKDVVILQNLLKRSEPFIKLTGVFDKQTEKAVKIFQTKNGLCDSGILNPVTAKAVVENLISDGYKDDGVIPKGCMFKLHVPVYRNRSIETMATLYNGDGDVIYNFTVRTRGSNKYGVELNQLTTNGDTPTGLMTFDLNTREPIKLVKLYGPYPVLRCVQGLKGNAAIRSIGSKNKPFISYYRSGILLHTGYWDQWQEGKPMPNSNGCMHVSLKDMEKIVEILKKMGVTVNENPFGQLPYPYNPQGIISIEQID